MFANTDKIGFVFFFAILETSSKKFNFLCDGFAGTLAKFLLGYLLWHRVLLKLLQTLNVCWKFVRRKKQWMFASTKKFDVLWLFPKTF